MPPSPSRTRSPSVTSPATGARTPSSRPATAARRPPTSSSPSSPRPPEARSLRRSSTTPPARIRAARRPWPSATSTATACADVVVGITDIGVQVFPGLAGGGLGSPSLTPTPDGRLVRLGRLDANPGLDVAAAGWGTDTVTVLSDTGSGLVVQATYAADHDGWDDLEVGDVTGDGRDDVVVMSGQGLVPNLELLPQLAGGGFGAAQAADLGGNELTQGIGIGDLTNDGVDDVVASYGGNRPSSHVAVFPGGASGLGTPVIRPSYDVPEPVEVARPGRGWRRRRRRGAWRLERPRPVPGDHGRRHRARGAHLDPVREPLLPAGPRDRRSHGRWAARHRHRRLEPRPDRAREHRARPVAIGHAIPDADRRADAASPRPRRSRRRFRRRRRRPRPSRSRRRRPQGLATSPNLPAGVGLTWQAPASAGSSPVTGYRDLPRRGAGRGHVPRVGRQRALVHGHDRGQRHDRLVPGVGGERGGRGRPIREVIAVRATAPGAPRSLAASAPKPGQVGLTWQAPASNGGSAVTGYRIYRGSASGTETFLVAVGADVDLVHRRVGRQEGRLLVPDHGRERARRGGGLERGQHHVEVSPG